VIEQTGARDAMLVGFSMGGGEVARYMSRHAGKGVSQAVLVSSVVPYMLATPDNVDGTEPEVFDKLTAALTQDRAKFFGHFFKDFYGFKILPTVSSECLEWTRSVAMQASLKATLDGVLTLFAVRILPFDTRAARRYGDLAVKARVAGKGFPTPDGCIAAIAGAHGFAVASRDTGAFAVAGLTVIDPWA
jgi:predicted nucleic acid-binding protein